MGNDARPRVPSPKAHADTNCVLVWLGRLLLILSAVSLVTMPFTQHLWTWDRFLHGGQDFELTVLAILTVLSMVLVVSQRCRRCIDRLAAQRYLVAGGPKKPGASEISAHRTVSAFPGESIKGPASGLGINPLRKIGRASCRERV